jgi:hypothetical protein
VCVDSSRSLWDPVAGYCDRGYEPSRYKKKRRGNFWATQRLSCFAKWLRLVPLVLNRMREIVGNCLMIIFSRRNARLVWWTRILSSTSFHSSSRKAVSTCCCDILWPVEIMLALRNVINSAMLLCKLYWRCYLGRSPTYVRLQLIPYISPPRSRLAV